MKGNNQAYKLWLCLLCSFLLLPLEIQAQEKGDSITGKGVLPEPTSAIMEA